jgi:hypothetical protein
MAVIAITEEIPIIIPNIVNPVRNLLLHKDAVAIDSISRDEME